MNALPTSRRDWLASAACGLGTLLPWPAPVRGGDRPLPDFSFLVVSDTHLGRGDQAGPARLWERTARELDAAEGAFVLHLGDIVDGGREAQYAVYKDIRRAIRKPIHEIPGNHDPQPHFQRHIRREVDLAFDHGGVRFLLFNDSRPDSHDGFLTAEQLGWIGRQCDEAARRDLFVILATHVPVHANRHPDRGWHVQPRNGQEALYALLARHRSRVLALLHGHFHNGIRGWNDHGPLQEVVLPSALYNQDRGLTRQNAPGFHLNEFRPGYVRIALGREGMTLRYHALGAGEATRHTCPLRQWQQS